MSSLRSLETPWQNEAPERYTDRGGIGGTKSHTLRVCQIKLFGTEETISVPVEVTTKVLSIKELLASKLGVDLEVLSFVKKVSCTFRHLHDSDEIPSSVTLKGIKSFAREKASYAHPHCIIGAGHHGLRQALGFIKDGIKDFVVFDRLDKVGGAAWILNANPSSKLQTELGVYHLQYDPDFIVPRAMKTWPSRQDLLAHFDEVCTDFGIMAHVQLQTEVVKMLKVFDKDTSSADPNQCHFVVSTLPCAEEGNLESISLADGQAQELGGDNCSNQLLVDAELDYAEQLAQKVISTDTSFSTVACYPGGLVANIRMEYKGEDVFLGQIGYGMFNEFDYTQVRDSPVVIVGMGAFAVENIRTCLEHGASKVSIVCRRKNIAIPRAVDWFINQSLYPPRAAMLLDAMVPMYSLIAEDPWSYYAVQASQDRRVVTIKQKSRFGIGDFFFLASHYGKCETLVGNVKRLQATSVILESSTLIPADHFVKVLGFTADQKIDILFGTKEMVGFFANGDWRTWIAAEFPGIDAGRFGGTSLSPAGLQLSDTWTWLVNYPRDAGLLLVPGLLPKQKADKESGRPSYVWPPRTGGSIYMILSGGVVPGLAEIAAQYGVVNRQKMLECHPLDKYIQECAEEWNMYCQMFKQAGDDRPSPPYPYTLEFMQELVDRNDCEGEAEMQRSMTRT
eukprot:TRINITY_DN89067_c0_g1_i1.p1 TRINITY_DN89067_c0_g1~~TRINITY_DN89067_c0_g1_i1.p1  ORF type:complete len:677 (-),score=121.14 TRINITY_DN89067_c0_g1_i1:13-2043(-)